jgi:hypothetical protein
VDTNCVRCQPYYRQRGRVTVLVLVVVILVVTAVQGWTLSEVLAVIVAATAAPGAARSLRAAES